MYEHVFQAAITEFFLWKYIHTGSRPIQATIKSTSIQLWVHPTLATGVTMFMVYEVCVVVVVVETLLLSSGMTLCSLVDKY